MSIDPDGPADTAMMGIVHDALRRDLRRLQAALSTTPPPQRRRPLAEHAAWMMRFLHAHHAGEDAGLYPLVRAAAPANGEVSRLLAAMDAEHHAIHPAMDQVLAHAQEWDRAGSDAERLALAAALDELASTLLPHLDREEAEAMPLVSRTLTHRQWSEWDQQYNVAPKSLPTLAEEGNWLIDDLDPHRRRTVLALVPLVPRLVVLHVFGPRYRRRAAARWGDQRPSSMDR